MRIYVSPAALAAAAATVGRHMPFRELRRIAADALRATPELLATIPEEFRGLGPIFGGTFVGAVTADGAFAVELVRGGDGRGRSAWHVVGLYVRGPSSTASTLSEVASSSSTDTAPGLRRRACDAPLDQDPRAALAAEEPRPTEPQGLRPGLGEAGAIGGVGPDLASRRTP